MLIHKICCATLTILFLAASAALAADLTGSWKGQPAATDGSSSDVEKRIHS
jgi:hypothetical protein